MSDHGPMRMDELWVCRLPVVDYREALALQERVRGARQADLVPDVLLLLEHPPVYTRGRRSDPAEQDDRDLPQRRRERDSHRA